jgi:hypothetical protein
LKLPAVFSLVKARRIWFDLIDVAERSAVFFLDLRESR